MALTRLVGGVLMGAGGALLAGCGGGVPGLGSEEVSALLPGAYHANGVSVTVQAVEARRDKTVVEMRVVNGTENAVELTERNDPMLLVDAAGERMQSTEEKIELQPYSVNVLRAEFAGRAGEGPLTLLINSRYGNDSREPKLTVRGIPTPARKTEFSSPLPAGAAIASRGGHHPSGAVVTLGQIGYVRDGIELSFAAVNGSDREIKLASRRPYLQDPQGNRYYYVPPDANPDLRVPAGEKLVGVLRFAGRISPAAGSLSLHFNEPYGGTNEYSSTPKITITDIPVSRNAP